MTRRPPHRNCPGCGRSDSDCDGCLPDFDPPRYCDSCGAWLATAVSPTGWTARCRRCGATRPQPRAAGSGS
ncbi:MAG: hypothetical protein OXE79_05080 [Acidimicrobiaceae bacterium]|nr:hypothetical protein [Acidimicrobiaceae bacterium]MCY4175802.1 hypothetical protein [Acidimicrobiaceae bacterium]MCY4279353.1 hypothetical protein [Acidimicrobiaceae bacterium]MCY4295308.1 hypothetical protein [Acidimicrobiaceae bacterium]